MNYIISNDYFCFRYEGEDFTIDLKDERRYPFIKLYVAENIEGFSFWITCFVVFYVNMIAAVSFGFGDFFFSIDFLCFLLAVGFFFSIDYLWMRYAPKKRRAWACFQESYHVEKRILKKQEELDRNKAQLMLFAKVLINQERIIKETNDPFGFKESERLYFELLSRQLTLEYLCKDGEAALKTLCNRRSEAYHRQLLLGQSSLELELPGPLPILGTARK